jgi:predicted transcriptional regulator
VEPSFSTVDETTPVATLAGLFNQGTVVIVLHDKQITGVITKIDLIEYMASKLS